LDLMGEDIKTIFQSYLTECGEWNSWFCDWFNSYTWGSIRIGNTQRFLTEGIIFRETTQLLSKINYAILNDRFCFVRNIVLF
jgi:hypothetical protein